MKTTAEAEGADDYREDVDELVPSRGTTISPGLATLKVERTASSR